MSRTSTLSTTTASSGLFSQIIRLLRTLQAIELGPKRQGRSARMGLNQLSQLLRLLMMLLENGLSMPKALSSLAADHSMKKYRDLLVHMRLVIEAGGSLSEAMSHYPRTFTAMQVQQVRIGEQSGALEKAMGQICEQVERKVALRKRIIKKVSYPIMITVAGSGLMIFMCTFVVPEFENVYASSGVELPAVTQVVTRISRFVINYGWMTLPAVLACVVAWKTARKKAEIARKTDAWMLRLPIVGPWARDAAVLQFSEAICSMVECGYTPVDAVKAASECVRNRAVRASVEEVKRSVQRGERLSIELAKHDRYFPATMCQLVGIGEQSGDFERAMRGTTNHLRERLETRIDASVGLLEPVLTILLAIAIGGIVLSIYTPMFHMFEVLE
jgi:type II secretory pathway component PulF